MTTIIDRRDPCAVAAVEAIHRGDTERLRQLLTVQPELATAALGDGRAGGTTRSLLHGATDWPSHSPTAPRPSPC